MVQAEHALDVGHLDLALDERRSDNIHIRFDLRLGIALEDVRLDGLHIAHDATEFVRTAVEPLAQREERTAVDFVSDLQESLRSLADAGERRCLSGFALVLGVSHRVEMSRNVSASHFASTVLGWVACAMVGRVERHT